MEISTVTALRWVERRHWHQDLAEIVPVGVSMQDLREKLKKLHEIGLIDYGTTITRPWLTREGERVLGG